MKKTIVVVGYGDSGSIYANYVAKYPDEREIAAVVATMDQLHYEQAKALR